MSGHDVLIDVPVQKGLKHFLLLESMEGVNLTVLDPDGPSTRTRNLDDLHKEMYQRKLGGFGIIKRLTRDSS